MKKSSSNRQAASGDLKQGQGTATYMMKNIIGVAEYGYNIKQGPGAYRRKVHDHFGLFPGNFQGRIAALFSKLNGNVWNSIFQGATEYRSYLNSQNLSQENLRKAIQNLDPEDFRKNISPSTRAKLDDAFRKKKIRIGISIYRRPNKPKNWRPSQQDLNFVREATADANKMFGTNYTEKQMLKKGIIRVKVGGVARGAARNAIIKALKIR